VQCLRPWLWALLLLASDHGRRPQLQHLRRGLHWNVLLLKHLLAVQIFAGQLPRSVQALLGPCRRRGLLPRLQGRGQDVQLRGVQALGWLQVRWVLLPGT
jgi:hypothetical protein